MPRPRPPAPRARHAVVVLVAVAFGIAGLAAPAASAATVGPPTIISLTFDDANADQLQAAAIMNKAGLHGTFYTVSGFVGQPGYLTRSDLQGLAAGGHEIGGHSVTHPDLATLSDDEAARQICNDRVNLTGWGFRVTSFAYPFASSTAATERLAQSCGYNSARSLGDIRSPKGCPDCDYAETVPPADPYNTQAVDEVDSTWTTSNLQKVVTDAQKNGGGWVQFTFHHVCSGKTCDPLSVSPSVFQTFVNWIVSQTKNPSKNTVVKTVDEVIGGPVAPAHAGPVAPPAAPGVNGIQNPSLETASATAGIPRCFMAGGYGANTPTYTTTTRAADAHSGTKAEQLTVTGYSSGDAKLVPELDLGACAPGAVPGHTYSLRTWYRSTASTQFAVYYRTPIGTWAYWTSSPYFAATTTWAQAVWTTPPLPDGATAVSYGLNLFGNGTLATDDYALYDSIGAPAQAAGRSALAPSAGASSREGITSPSDAGRYVPGPAQVAPGTTFVPDEGPLAG